MKYPMLARLACFLVAACGLTPAATASATPITSYSSSLSFDSTQGTNGWRWRHAAVDTNSYTDYNAYLGGAWSKDTQNNWNWGVFHSHKRVQPGVSADLVAEFTAPTAGTLKIFSRTPARITDTYNSLDGVRLKILKNDTQLWPESGWSAVTPGREVHVPEIRIHVAPGDKIRFRVNCVISGQLDQLNWEFDVAYEALPEAGLYSPTTSYGTTQGQDGWRWQNADPAQGDAADPADLDTPIGNRWWSGSQNNWSQGTVLHGYRMQPGSARDVVTTFVCPVEGEIDIQTLAPVQITNGFSSTDGVRIKILKNDTPLWPASGWQLVGPSGQIIVPPIRTHVVPGDEIRFKVNCNANGVSDDTTWHFGVAYAATYLSGANLQADILAAHAAGAGSYTIPPGVYRVPQPTGATAHINLTNLQNFEIDATGVRLLFEGTAHGIRFFNSTGVTLRGATLDYAKLAHAQGEVIDITGNTLRVRMDAGYPLDFDNPARFPTTPVGYVYDPATLKLKPGSIDYYGTSSQRVDADEFDIAVPSVAGVVIGDLMAFRSHCGMGVVLYGCGGINVLDVTVHGGGIGLLESNGEGGNTYDNYRVTYGPTPSGATRPRLLSTCADGLHSGNMRIGPNVDGCVFTGMGDDGMNIHGVYGMVMGIESATTFVVGFKSGNPFKIGDEIRALDRVLGPRGSGVVGTVSGSLSGYTPQQASWFAEFTPGVYFRITVAGSIAGLALGDWIANPDSSGSGFSITNSVFRNNRARGVVIKAENGTIANNVFDGSSMHSILITPELYWAESGYAAGLTIAGNTFRNAGYHGTGRAAVRIDAEHAQGHDDIAIVGNLFESNYSTDLSIRSGTDFTVENNVFNARHATVTGTASDREPHIKLANLTGIYLTGNTFASGRFPVTSEPSVTGITGTPTPVKAFTASTAFGDTQGNQSWQWRHAPIGTDNYAALDTFVNGAWWSGAQATWSKGMMRASRLQPGSTHDVSRTFTVPASGTATLRTVVPITANYSGSDGVQVKILKNNTQLWPASGWQTVLPGSPVSQPDQVVSVQTGDVIDFRVNIKGTATYDDTTWEPVVYVE